MMNVKEFVREISKETEFSQKDISTVLEAAESIMIDAVVNNDGVKIFKSLSVVPTTRKERVAISPTTKESVVIPARKTPKAKFSQNFKNVCNR